MAAPSDDQRENDKPTEQLTVSPINYYDLLDKMIGYKKERFTDIVVPNVGIPQPARPLQEIRIASFFESCSFKTGLSCVAGQ